MMAHPPLFSLRSHRLRVCLLLMLGLYATVSMRVNLSMGVTCMVNSTAYSTEPTSSAFTNNSQSTAADAGSCRPIHDAETEKNDGYGGSLLWSPTMRSLLFSATFYGGLLTMPISGYFADRFGPKMIFLFAGLDFVLMSLAGPLLAENSYWAYFTSRIVMGLGEGFVFPCLNSMAAKWIPPNEKSTAGALYTSGNQLAAGFTAFIVAGLCTSPLGWPAIFYLFGALGLLWALLWQIFVSNTPHDNKWISIEEVEYLEKHVAPKKNLEAFGNGVPWKNLLFGKVVLAVYTSQFGFNFSASLMQSFLPTYFKEVLYIPIHMNGLFTMVPFIAQLISKNILGLVSDYLKRNEILNADQSAKIFQGIGSAGSAITLAALAIVPSCENPYIALPILAAYGTFFSAGICGFFTSLISIAPPYSGTMTSISMTYATIANCAGPMMLSLIDFMGWPHKWFIVFFCASAFNVITGIFFVIYGEGKVQSWALPPTASEKPTTA